MTKKRRGAKQSFKDACDINLIMKRHAKTGVLDHLAVNPGTYGDFANADDYLTNLNKVAEANSAFEGLDPHIRARFKNDPAELIAFLDDDKNYDEAVEMRIIPPPSPPSAPESEVPAKTEEKELGEKDGLSAVEMAQRELNKAFEAT